MSVNAPNLVALLGKSHADTLLALPGVSLHNLLASTPAAITQLGKPVAAAAAAATAETAAGDDGLSRGWIYRLEFVASLPPKEKQKGANIVASAIKIASGADVGRKAADGAVGREQLERARKRLQELVPLVDLVEEEDRVLARPDDDEAWRCFVARTELRMRILLRLRGRGEEDVKQQRGAVEQPFCTESFLRFCI